jgi:nitrogen fixation-related uncharacterized protein
MIALSDVAQGALLVGALAVVICAVIILVMLWGDKG